MLRIVRSYDKLGDHGLDESAWLLGRGFGDAKEAFAEIRLGRYPSETAAWGDGLGESVEADDATLVVDGEVGGNEGVQKRVACGLLVHGPLLDGVVEFDMGRPRQKWVVLIGCIGGRILEVPVRVVFNDDDVEFNTNGIYFFPALNAQCATRGVLTNARLKSVLWSTFCKKPYLT